MCEERKEGNETTACCAPKDFQEMFKMMQRCCAGKKITIDCSSMMEMMRKGGCCSGDIEKPETGS